jgi:hypothetical protein
MRFLQPLASGLWIWFLLWTGLVAFLWLTGFGEAQATEWLQRHFLTPDQRAENVVPALQAPLLTLLRLADPVWIVLAAMNAYASLIGERGLATGRRWMGLLLLSAVVILYVSAVKIGIGAAWSSFPLGPIHFSSRLGLRFGPIALGWALLWCIVILGSRELARLIFPSTGHGAIAATVGLLAVVTDTNLEPVAWKIRAWWLWYPGQLPIPDHPPLQNYATWLLGALLLAYLLRSSNVIRPGVAKPWRAAVTLLLLNALCLATSLAERLR